MNVGQGVTLLRPGKVVAERAGFHCPRYIYPAGFCSAKLWWSTLNPTVRTTYHSEILDDGSPMPVFQVTCMDEPERHFRGTSATGAWAGPCKLVNDARGIQINISGPNYYGLASEKTRRVIEGLPGADLCLGYECRNGVPTAAALANTPGIKKRKRVTEHSDSGSGGDASSDELARGGKRGAGSSNAGVRVLREAPKQDATGAFILPLDVSGTTVLSLGTVEWQREAFHSKAYIWPIGFHTVRRFVSLRDVESKVDYHCEIIDGGTKPLFRVSPSDAPDEAVTEPTATAAWKIVMAKVNDVRFRKTGRYVSNSVTGPGYFGFAHATVAYMIQNLPNADKCRQYVPQVFVLSDGVTKLRVGRTGRLMGADATPKRPTGDTVVGTSALTQSSPPKPARAAERARFTPDTTNFRLRFAAQWPLTAAPASAQLVMASAVPHDARLRQLAMDAPPSVGERVTLGSGAASASASAGPRFPVPLGAPEPTAPAAPDFSRWFDYGEEIRLV